MKFARIRYFLLLLVLPAAAYSSQFAEDGKGTRLRWKKRTIALAVAASPGKQNLNIKSDGEILDAVRKSAETWEKVANVKFEIGAVNKQSVSPGGKFGDGVNLITIAQTPENLFLFGGDGAEEVSARTRTFFNGKGFITEADIVLNPYGQFSIDGSLGTFDLEATLTHEIGHLLGLEHSLVSGATMFEHQGKNGIYGLPNFSARTLSKDDISGVRTLYGAGNSDADCCGTAIGKLSFVNGKAAKEFQIWVEEAETGRVASAVTTTADGSFRFEGLTAGKYSVFAQSFGEKKIASGQQIGTVEIGKNKTASFTKKIKTTSKTFEVRSVGFNWQLSDVAVPLRAGNSFLIYVGGKNLDAENFYVDFSSPFFSFVPNSLTEQDFGSEMSVLSFEINVNPQTPPGEYSFFLQSKNGETAYLPGSLTVEDVPDP